MTEDKNGGNYGRSPALDALPDMEAIIALPPEERRIAAIQFMRWLYGDDVGDGVSTNGSEK